MSRSGSVNGRGFVDAVISVDKVNGDRGSDGHAATKTGKELRPVALDLHTPAATIPTLSPFQLGVDQLNINGDTGRHALDERNEGGSVRLTRCSIVQTRHNAMICPVEEDEQGRSLADSVTPPGDRPRARRLVEPIEATAS